MSMDLPRSSASSSQIFDTPKFGFKANYCLFHMNYSHRDKRIKSIESSELPPTPALQLDYQRVDMAVLEPYKGGYYLWKYLPSIEAAAVFCVLFVAVTVSFCWRMYKTRTWFCIPFAIGGFSKSNLVTGRQSM
jgi:hypothetical protein